MQNYAAALFFIGLSRAAVAISSVLNVGQLLRHVTDEYRGRVFATTETLIWSTMMLSMMGAGIASQHHSPREIGVVSGIRAAPLPYSGPGPTQPESSPSPLEQEWNPRKWKSTETPQSNYRPGTRRPDALLPTAPSVQWGQASACVTASSAVTSWVFPSLLRPIRYRAKRKRVDTSRGQPKHLDKFPYIRNFAPATRAKAHVRLKRSRSSASSVSRTYRSASSDGGSTPLRDGRTCIGRGLAFELFRAFRIHAFVRQDGARTLEAIMNTQ